MGDIRVYATFSEEEKKDGYNVSTAGGASNPLPERVKAVLVSSLPFLYNPEGPDVYHFWVAEIDAIPRQG